ncbi:hypothetical protein [Natronospora cellulosivora (SeqCode)]
MAIRQICVSEVTNLTTDYAETITCTNPGHTPTAAGDDCNIHVYNVGLNLNTTPPTLSFSFDSQFQYKFHDDSCATFNDYCNVMGSTGSITLPTGVTLCCDGAISPEIQASASCDAGQITTTETSVSGPVSLAFTITNLCAPTIICVEDTDCLNNG